MPNKPFLSGTFLLESDAAVTLYQKYASVMPILDYHNHLSPKEIAGNRKFNNITEAWLEGDHYKWRAMRINGVAEEFCTGSASPFDKFKAWSQTVPFTVRNPLFHWTHLELKNYFGITQLLNENSTHEIYEQTSAMLRQDDFRVQSLLSKMNVEVVCTTDDPIDSLEYHDQFAKQSVGLKMYPSFRPDKAYTSDDITSYNNYLDKLSEVAGTPISTLDDLLSALRKRITFFDQLGCRSADHGLESLHYNSDSLTIAATLFKKARERKALDLEEQQKLRCAVLIHLCKIYHEVGWVQQFHLGALRGNNSRMAKMIGADSGFDSIGEFNQASMTKFFDHLDSTNQLAKTVIYNSNPSHNELFAAMVGNFSDGSVPGKIQFGAGWWFLDQKEGIERQINALSNMALLSRFVGMVTDSRSFLSFPRHEYFRRILCNLIGKDIERGELPEDFPLLGKMIQDVCYQNAGSYFRF
ncbi:uronate isomerase [Cytophagales bacterium WSM2-2]|nr:uronate isomerase [Cytophagales bacterium WSM2-2]